MLRRIFLLTLLSLSASQAALISITSVDWNRGGNVTFLADGVEETGYAGLINGTYDGTPLDFLCVDLFTGISYGDYSSSTVFPRGWRNEDLAAWLFLDALPNVTTTTLGQALQLAIWDIVHDGGDGLGYGRIQASANTDIAVSLATANYLTASLNQSSYAASIFLNFTLQTGEPAQAFLGALQPGTITSTPEPSSLGMLAIAGLLTLGTRRLVRQR